MGFSRAAHADIEQQPDDADHHHARDHQVVAVAGVARVDDQESEPGVDRDHLRGHDHQPGDAERDPQADDQLRHHRGIQHVVEERSHAASRSCGRRSRSTSGMMRDRVHRRDRERQERGQEDQEDGRQVADAEPEDGDRNPGQRRDRPQDLDQRIERQLRAAVPADATGPAGSPAPPPRRSPTSRGTARPRRTSAAVRGVRARAVPIPRRADREGSAPFEM